MTLPVLGGRMGTDYNSHGYSFTITLPKWIFLTLVFFLLTGIELATGITCYGAAQLSCYENLTELVVLIQGREETSNQEMDTCGAFYAVQDCFIPRLANCDREEQDMFIEDVVKHMAQPPYHCKNQSIDGLERNNTDSSHHPQHMFCLCGLLILIQTVINHLVTREKR